MYPTGKIKTTYIRKREEKYRIKASHYRLVVCERCMIDNITLYHIGKTLKPAILRIQYDACRLEYRVQCVYVGFDFKVCFLT